MKLTIGWSLAIITVLGCAPPPLALPTSTAENQFTSLSSEATITIAPTQNIREQKEMVLSLMESNRGCELPCWWGITPGQTSLSEVEEYFHILGARTGRTQQRISGNNFFGARFENSLPEFNISFLDIEGNVYAIYVSGNQAGTQDQSDFELFWEPYSPKNVVTDYGAPSRILLSAYGGFVPGTTGKQGYILWIIYDSLGIMIRYDGLIQDLPMLHFCPELALGANNIHRIEITLQNPSNPRIPIGWIDSILGNEPERVKSIQEAANLSMEDFYELFSQSEKPACFDTPKDIWPK